MWIECIGRNQYGELKLRSEEYRELDWLFAKLKPKHLQVALGN